MLVLSFARKRAPGKTVSYSATWLCGVWPQGTEPGGSCRIRPRLVERGRGLISLVRKESAGWTHRVL